MRGDHDSQPAHRPGGQGALVKYSFFAPLGLRSATSIATMHGQVGGDQVRLFQEVNAKHYYRAATGEHRVPGEH